MPPDETDEERLEKLPGDDNTPFGPASTDEGHFTHPDTDTGIDSDELYNSGIDNAANIKEPNKNDTVQGYKGSGDTDFNPDTRGEEEAA